MAHSVEVLLHKSNSPAHTSHTIEQLCGGDTNLSLMQVCQEHVRSLLLYRYAQDTVMLVDEASRSSVNKSRGLVVDSGGRSCRAHEGDAGNTLAGRKHDLQSRSAHVPRSTAARDAALRKCFV